MNITKTVRSWNTTVMWVHIHCYWRT